MGFDGKLAIVTVAFVLFIAMNIAMFISLGKQGDERRKAIIEKSSASTFAVVVVYILYCVVEGVVKSIARGVAVEGMNPFVTLTVIAMIYTAHLLYYKKKFGD